MDKEIFQKNIGGSQKDVGENKIMALLSYFGILCLIPLLLKRDSRFVQFHAKQGLVLMIGWFFAWIPIVGWFFLIPILLIVSIIGVVNVLEGRFVKIPIIGDLAEKFNI